MNSNISKISIIAFLWNPVTLSILLNSIRWGVFISLGMVLFGLIMCRANSLRLKVWAFNIAALLSIAYHAELLFVHFAGDKNMPNLYKVHGKFYFNKPFLDQKFITNEYISHYRTNCQGYRIDELTNPDDSIKNCDWLFIGDSFTQGAQVDYSQLFTTLIYRHFPDKIIVNAGISGAGLYEELNFYNSLGRNLRPQKVFLQIGVFNDFKDVVEHSNTFQDWLAEKSSLYRYISYNIGQQDEMPLGRWMEPFFMNKQDNIDGNILYIPTSEKKELDKRRFRECISKFKNAVESNGGELVLILLPSKEQTSSEMLQETLKECNLNETDIDLSLPNRLCRDIANNEGLKLIDLYDDFRTSDFPFFQIDEHLSIAGHEIIAKRIITEYAKDVEVYTYISPYNRNERYPSLLSDSITILTQYNDKDRHYICQSDIYGQSSQILWSSVKELVHPSINSIGDYLVFTVGNQERHETEVVLFDIVNRQKQTLNKKGSSASIPMFNNSGTQVVYPQWDSDMIPYITIFDIATSKIISTFKDGVESWRPIFSKGDSLIYYISKETIDSKFSIKSFSIKNKSITTLHKAPYDIWDIALSPSGKYIAYAGNKDGNWDLFLLNIESKETKQITHTRGNEWDPSFGYNDNDLWFAGVFGINDGIYRIELGL